MELKNNKGRPIEGIQRKTIDRKVRLEPYVDNALAECCRKVGITRAQGIREGILLFIKAVAKQ